MAPDDESDAFPRWARLGIAFVVLGLWSAAYLGQLNGRPGPSPVLNGMAFIVVGSIFSHEVMRSLARALRRALSEADERSRD